MGSIVSIQAENSSFQLREVSQGQSTDLQQRVDAAAGEVLTDREDESGSMPDSETRSVCSMDEDVFRLSPTGPLVSTPGFQKEEFVDKCILSHTALCSIKVLDKFSIREGDRDPVNVEFIMFKTKEGPCVKGYKIYNSIYLIDSLLLYIFHFLVDEPNAILVDSITAHFSEVIYHQLMGLKMPTTREIFSRHILGHILKICYKEFLNGSIAMFGNTSMKFWRLLHTMSSFEEEKLSKLGLCAIQEELPFIKANLEKVDKKTRTLAFL